MNLNIKTKNKNEYENNKSKLKLQFSLKIETHNSNEIEATLICYYPFSCSVSTFGSLPKIEPLKCRPFPLRLLH